MNDNADHPFIRSKNLTKVRPEKLCVCGKIRHKSEGAALAGLRSLRALYERGDATDRKNSDSLRVYQCNLWPFAGESWHVGH